MHKYIYIYTTINRLFLLYLKKVKTKAKKSKHENAEKRKNNFIKKH